MKETFEQKIRRRARENDLFECFASDAIEIIDDRDKLISDLKTIIESQKVALSSADDLLENKYDYKEHCDCSYSGSGGTVSMCDFHKKYSQSSSLIFDYETKWLGWHKGR